MTPIFGSSDGDPEQFRRLLDEEHEWPSTYVFKFIVPAERLDDLRLLLEGQKLETRSSRNGNYVSVTVSQVVDSSQAVVQLYIRVSIIEGLLAP